MVFSIWNNVLNILFPRYCILCRADLGDSEPFELLCQTCFLSLRQVRLEYMRTRGLDRILFYGAYGDESMQRLISNAKYYGAASLALPLSELLARTLEDYGIMRLCQGERPVITFVPLHPLKQRFRGYNQSHLLALYLGEYFSLPVLPLLRRAWLAPPQASLENTRQRKENSKGAFSLLISAMPHKVILVDDVYTSGATMEAAASALRKGGVKTIWGVTVAGAGRH